MKLIQEFKVGNAKFQVHKMEPADAEHLVKKKEDRDVSTDELIKHPLWINLQSTFNQSDKDFFLQSRKIRKGEIQL